MNHRLEQLRRVFVIAVALFFGGAAVMTAFTVLRLRTDGISAGLDVSALHSRSFEALITQNLHVVGLIAVDVLSGTIESAGHRSVATQFASILSRAPYLRSISLVDTAGRIVASSNPDNVDLTIETARFLPQASGIQELLRIGVPWVGRDFVSGRPVAGGSADATAPSFIPITQTIKVNDRAVTVLVALNPDYFLNLFSRTIGEQEGAVRVLRYDGVLLMSTSASESPGDSQAVLLKEMRLDEVESGVFQRTFTGRSVLTSYQTSRAYPVVIVTDVARDFALRNWESQARVLVTVVGAVLLAVVSLSFAYYRRQQEAIRDRVEAERLQRINATVFDSSAEAIVIADAESFIISANTAFRCVAGYADEELIGRRLPDLFDDAGRRDFAEMVKHVDARLPSDASPHRETSEARLRCRDGRWIWTEILSTPQFDPRGKVTGYHRICRDISERRQMEEQVRQLAFSDPLTQLANRRLFLDRLKSAISLCRRSSSFGAVLFLDLDNFKPLNDTCGHDAGDLLLIEAANRLRSCVRDSDSVGRFGGDEFVVVLASLSRDRDCSLEQAGMVAEKIRLRLASPFMLECRSGNAPPACVEHRCTSSIGLTLFSDGDTAENVIRQADIAMYQAKEGGGNTVRCFDASPRDGMRETPESLASMIVSD